RAGDGAQQGAGDGPPFLGRTEREMPGEIWRGPVYDGGVVAEEQTSDAADQRNTNETFAFCRQRLPPNALQRRIPLDHPGRASFVHDGAAEIARGINAIIMTGPRRV